MRILHVTNEVRNNGTGITNVLVDLAIEQARAGHAVSIACVVRDASFGALCAEHGVRIERLPDHRSPARLPAAVGALAGIVRRLAPEVVHAHTVRALGLAAVARGVRRPVPVVATVHNAHQRSALLMGLADRTVFVSDSLRRTMRLLPVPRRRLTTVRNGTLGSARFADVRHVVPRDLEHPAIVYVGGMLPVKGVDVLLAAFDRLAARRPEAHLYLVGNRDNPGLEAVARALPSAARMHFEGFHADPRGYMKAADLVVLPSRREALGLVVSEARSCGAVVVGSAVGGIPEALDGGEAGVLVPPEDPPALARALAELLADDGLRRRLSARAGQNLAGFTTRAMARRYLEVYRDLVARRPRSRGPGGPTAARPVPHGARESTPLAESEEAS